MNFHNKIECLYLETFPENLMFVSKARAYLREALFRYSTPWWAPGLTHKYYMRLEGTVREKHLLRLSKITAVKSFMTLAPSCR